MAAYVQSMASPQSAHQHYMHCGPLPQHRAHRHGTKQRFVAELSRRLFEFVLQLLPTQEEMAVKEDVRKLLERLIRTIEPHSRLLSFGSTANGFSLRNSDMDLCCLIDSAERLSASDLVTMLGDLLERETKFHVKPLPHARIPIVKLSLDPSPGLPLGIACDIGFENRLALENTRLLMCYAMIDPSRVRTLVLFLKVWSKRRKINSPYKGTLSSYGYVLLVIYFLVHVKNPPVLPNLQQMPPLRPISPEDTLLAGYNTWFFDDIDLLRQRWHSSNMESVGELLIDFFRYFSRDFLYNTGVASIRSGLLKKESKGWQHELTSNKYPDPSRERNRLCIEDPFEIDFNVARCVTKDGLYTIRGEFMRAARILAARPDAIVALAQLCEERKEEVMTPPPPTVFIPPRLSNLPPQTPYTVGSNSLRPKGVTSPERLSPQPHFFNPTPKLISVQPVPDRLLPDHMAPKRSKWTSPPPPEAPPSDHTSFEDKLGLSLELATSSTDARESELSYTSSSSNSEVLSDDEPRSETAESDEVQSIRSFTEGSSPSVSFRRVPWLCAHDSTIRMNPIVPTRVTETHDRVPNSNRGRPPSRVTDKATVPLTSQPSGQSNASPAPVKRLEYPRRSSSGPPRTSCPFSWSSPTPIALSTPLPPSPVSPHLPYAGSTVFYETNGSEYSPSYPNSGTHSAISNHQQNPSSHVIELSSPRPAPPPTSQQLEDSACMIRLSDMERPSPGFNTPTPTSFSHPSHSHSLSTTTVTLPTPPANASNFPRLIIDRSYSPLTSSSPSSPPGGSASPRFSQSNESDSPPPSLTGYATSMSRSPSPSPSDPSTPETKGRTMLDASLSPSCQPLSTDMLAEPLSLVAIRDNDDHPSAQVPETDEG